MENNNTLAGMHLTVDAVGMVSLWDDAETAQRIPGETYVNLQLTDEQRRTIRQAQARAIDATSLIQR